MDYALHDFLMFTPEVYLRLFVRVNATLGPWLALVIAALASMALLLSRNALALRRLAFMLMAAGWGLSAGVFMVRFYAPINWPVGWLAWAFALEALLLLMAAVCTRPEPVRVLSLPGSLVVVTTLSLATAWAAGSWRALSLPAVTPDMTAVTTMLMLVLLPRSWRWGVLIVPLLWCLFSLLIHWALGLWLPLGVSAAGLVIGLAAALWPHRPG
ncbi:hypothetical protein [Kushneria phosphatilytica]|uniref:Uncharacterized protein n=1 Tax=Kushneria phosphatilytica TaxID=657387 RepID=A0A1S1NSB6_9GAMM|nr:hypothetical protein [Kushneria phosphatilytica]OHV08914.1 hypothetical protein BH688_13005 [Kushneria phosphatilytica]QEL12633.1 hypothetical protein FY550_16790 [Kushneria phosphatilytica]